jgi:Zn finger protein HypA/HybF involved in hydrogenase expression
MHELSLVSDLVDACVRQAGERRVSMVRVRVAGTVPMDLVRQAFTMLTSGTRLEHAALEIDPFDVRMSCGCGFEGALEHDDLVGPSLAICPQCDALQRLTPVPEIELLEVQASPMASGATRG